jgi:carbon-monoxide dehydrogenase medium subunit
MKKFEFFAPETRQEATGILSDHGSDARVLAGGTDLLIRMKRLQWTPRVVVSLNRISDLRGIALNGDLRMGARVTLGELVRSSVVRAEYPVLAYTASKMAGVQVRALATVGGNLCNASPSADMAPPLIALGAYVIIQGIRGERSLDVAGLFRGPGQNALEPGEILAEIRVPRPGANTRASYIKLEHREAMDIAIAGVAVSVTFEPESGFCKDIRIVLGAVAPVPMRALEAEALLRGKELSEERIREAAGAAAGAARPIDDVRASAWYRREMVETLTRRQLLAIMASWQSC